MFLVEEQYSAPLKVYHSGERVIHFLACMCVCAFVECATKEIIHSNVAAEQYCRCVSCG